MTTLNTEFKKDQMTKKKAMKLSTTQKIFKRKDIFAKKKAPPHVADAKG
jgi:hypothetical protein